MLNETQKKFFEITGFDKVTLNKVFFNHFNKKFMEQLSILAALITPAKKLKLAKIDKGLCQFFDELFEKGYTENDFKTATVQVCKNYVKIVLDANVHIVKSKFLRFGMQVGETVSYQIWYKCLHIVCSDLKFEVDYQNSKIQYFN